ncbi:DUF2939 domain-containing protein [Gluconobacter wancherniae]|uniref:DUF2939 domain-containing protein n=1 Tax=Gluconobacter wancherniae NBRC 103581 TaxID=656744 RepID=A0A511B164_9PROT|nr:DUF2939 domain-containing protein [Gluconobacter wancherniae]MBF0853381.1 DUF2939 domain-containing protein [Gluconobacter wancherniae]GBD55886.1 hypothetical protein NBRC103581_00457 [Gluconobacter wancherniae NBRC 103581]GBR65947.1 hypothetical protein AA103581_2094 [Gluconobacter wancherniae NBRC 103581]GEK93211.1 hypothetical protein GWA01_09810 [Gluconobacter wancherniae NBRC 103581]
MQYGFRKISPKVRNGFGVSVGAAIAAYAVSPYLALWDIDRALNGNNPGMLAPHVDWSSLTHSLKEEILPPAPVADDDLPGFGSSFAGAAVSHAIDVQLSPATLLSTARQMIPQGGATGAVLPDLGSIHAHFVSLGKFEAQVDQPGRTPFVLHMKFEHWSWKITRFEMPGSVQHS